MPLNIRQLDAFRSVVISGSVTNAADLMGVSQPAVSRLIAQFEEATHLTLFDRVKNRLVPTNEARLLLTEIERIFSSLDKVEAFAAELRGGRKGQLTIAAMPALGTHFLPQAVALFAATRPNVSVSFLVRSSADVQEAAVAQQIDFGLAEFPLDRGGFEHEVFCHTPDVVVFPAAHALAGRRRVVPGDLAGLPLIALGRGTTARFRLDDALDRAGIAARPVIETEHSSALCRLVAQGLGVGIVDVFTALDHRTLGVAFRPFDGDVEFKCGLLYPAYRRLSKPARDFLAVMRTLRQRLLAEADAASG